MRGPLPSLGGGPDKRTRPAGCRQKEINMRNDTREYLASAQYRALVGVASTDGLTNFGGRLRCDSDGLVWSDGTRETAAYLVSRGRMAPSYRVIGGYVQVPVADCTDSHPSADLGWCRKYPVQLGGFVEGRGGRHDSRGRVRLVPLADWDAWAAAPGGILWDAEDEAAVYARARACGLSLPPSSEGPRTGPSGHLL